YEILGGDLDVEIFHHRDVCQILLGNRRQRNRRDVELALFYEAQKQIERSVEALQTDAQFVFILFFGRGRNVGLCGQLVLCSAILATAGTSPNAAGLARTYSRPKSIRRFSFTYFSAFLACT